MKNNNKKRVLKKGVQKILSYILGIWFFWICTTIDTLDCPFNQIKGYLVFTSILTFFALISFILLFNYSNVFED